ncbi:MAG: PQQ-dependent sugar dehydrogenase [Wenzhouxiangellaceae bacterium]|nr:PQQ-dependent sugar dehydrogenase [Wenzhouxiangellaceae bacterium]
MFKRIFLIFFLLSTHAAAEIPADVSLETVPGVSGLSTPLGIKHAADGSGRLFIVEQGGTIRVIGGDGTLLATPFVNLGSLVTSGAERGLLDIAFHPLFVSNGLFYLHYSAGANRPAGTASGDTIVAEFVDNGDPGLPNTSPERVMLSVAQDFSNHNGGQMRFGPDGYLYIGLGDGGSGNDPCNRARTLDPADIITGNGCRSNPSVALLGKMLRIDVDQTTPVGENNLCAAAGDGSAEYSIPTENPFSGRADRCGEVLLYGLRNPWRWSFDRATADLWIGDVGQNTWEEIDRLAWPLAGADDLGWSVCEASWLRGSTSTPCNLADSVLPVLEYQRNNGNCSVTGGYRYRGPVTSLQGRYVYGDFCSGNVWFARQDGGVWQTELFQSIGSIRSFGEDEQGKLFVLSDSTLLRFAGETTDLIFADGFESSAR